MELLFAIIAVASNAALIAPSSPIASVPTGIPLGICAIDSKLSNPFSFLLSIGTPRTGNGVIAEIIPGKWADPPAPAGAGGSAHLPGMISAITPLPVLGVPIESKKLKGLDSLLSIAQMPKGIPVGTLAIGEDGAINAALLATAIIANNNSTVKKKLNSWRLAQTKSVKKSPK